MKLHYSGSLARRTSFYPTLTKNAARFWSGELRRSPASDTDTLVNSKAMKVRFLSKAIAILALYWIGARVTILMLQIYVPIGVGRVILESLYSVVWAIVLFFVMWPDIANYGLSLSTLPRKLTLMLLASYAIGVSGLLIWRVGTILLQPIDADALTQISRAVGFYWLVVCVIPVFEELLFRGLLQTWAHRAFPGGVGRGKVLSWGALVAAFLFSLLHLPFLWPSATRTWSAVSASLIAGIIFGIVRDRTKSIYPAMLLHSLGNLVGF